MIPPRCRYFILVLFLLSASFSKASGWADPSGFFEEEKISKQEIAPGVDWIAAGGQKWGSPFETHIIAVDLTRKGVSLRMLAGEHFLSKKPGHFVARSLISQYIKDHSALAAMNIPFFQIGSTQTPFGLLLIDGMLQRDPSPYYPAFLCTSDNRVFLATPGWEGSVHIGSQKRPLAGVNRSELGGDEVVLYTSFWTRSPGSDAPFLKERKTRELVLETLSFQPAKNDSKNARLSGRVKEIRDGKASVPIPGNTFVLAASESAIPFFRNVKPGQTIEVEWRLNNLPEDMRGRNITQAGAGSPVLIRGGKAQEGSGDFWKLRHPRSAIAISPGENQVLLVLVDGRSKASAGMNLAELSEYLLHLGARNALNVDGGGSSAIGALIAGKPRILNVPSDGQERYIPAALGVFEKK